MGKWYVYVYACTYVCDWFILNADNDSASKWLYGLELEDKNKQ